MISRVLVANRGEIAVRVIRACHDLGLEAVVVHSEPDAGSLAAELADRAVALAGAPPPTRTSTSSAWSARRLRANATRSTPATASWPSAPSSPRAVATAGLTWIGPSAGVIALMGDKLAARQVALDAGVLPVPGAMVAVDDTRRVRDLGDSLGWPLAVKAVHGGGGGGMRVIERAAEVEPTCSLPPGASRSRRSAARRCTSSGSSPAPATSRSSSSPTTTAASSSSATATARSSAATRS